MYSLTFLFNINEPEGVLYIDYKYYEIDNKSHVLII